MDAASILASFDFPDEANVGLSDQMMRRILHEVHGGIDFYSRAPLPLEQMRVDHVVPRALGGPDNLFNYVPTCQAINGAKSAKFDAIATSATLAIVRTHYAPKVLRLLEKARKEQEERLTAANSNKPYRVPVPKPTPRRKRWQLWAPAPRGGCRTGRLKSAW
jgi:hypothetical protein